MPSRSAEPFLDNLYPIGGEPSPAAAQDRPCLRVFPHAPSFPPRSPADRAGRSGRACRGRRRWAPAVRSGPCRAWRCRARHPEGRAATSPCSRAWCAAPDRADRMQYLSRRAGGPDGPRAGDETGPGRARGPERGGDGGSGTRAGDQAAVSPRRRRSASATCRFTTRTLSELTEIESIPYSTSIGFSSCGGGVAGPDHGREAELAAHVIRDTMRPPLRRVSGGMRRARPARGARRCPCRRSC